MKKYIFSYLAFISALMGSGVPVYENDEQKERLVIECSGIIVQFIKDGFQGMSLENGCETSDITWIKIITPEEYKGLKYMYLSNSADKDSPLGAVGDKVTFEAYESTLNSLKRSLPISVNSEELKKMVEEIESDHCSVSCVPNYAKGGYDSFRDLQRSFAEPEPGVDGSSWVLIGRKGGLEILHIRWCPIYRKDKEFVEIGEEFLRFAGIKIPEGDDYY